MSDKMIFKPRKGNSMSETEARNETAEPTKKIELLKPNGSTSIPNTTETLGRTAIKEVPNQILDAQRVDMEKVRQHQRKLNKYGADLEVDGVWGDKTAAASRELYPKYKAKPQASTPKGMTVRKPSAVTVETVDEGKRNVTPVDTSAATAYFADKNKAAKSSKTMTVKPQVKAPTLTKPEAPSPNFGYLGQKIRNRPEDQAKLAANDKEWEIYEKNKKAYEEQETNRVIDKSDSLAVANGVEPSKRYRDNQAKAAAEKKKGENMILFDREQTRQLKGAEQRDRKKYADRDKKEIEKLDANWERAKKGDDDKPLVSDSDWQAALKEEKGYVSKARQDSTSNANRSTMIVSKATVKAGGKTETRSTNVRKRPYFGEVVNSDTTGTAASNRAIAGAKKAASDFDEKMRVRKVNRKKKSSNSSSGLLANLKI